LKYSVPKHHNEKLISPPFEELGAAVESNRRRMEGYTFTIAGLSFPAFRRMARDEVLSLYGGGPVVLSAHQPGIPHMGVVEKLRLLQTLSAGNFASHIVLDTDEIEDVRAIIPLTRNGDRETKEFYLYRSDIPRAIFTIPAPRKEALGGTFSEMARCLESTGSKSIVSSFQRFRKIDEDVYDHDSNLGSLLASYLRRFFDYKGIRETTMSSICRTESWRAFARSVTDNIDGFSKAYNGCLGQFRKERNIKTPHSPFPDLLRSGEKIELPFWSVGEGGRRSRPFVIESGEMVDARGEKTGGSFLLPRAMTFTIFARLFLCDLFIHGTGGGNYDRATDMIIREYFGVEPPAYCVTTATVYPDLPMDREIELKIQRLKKELREIKQHPEKYAGPSRAATLLEEKARITSSRSGKLDRETHLRIKEINEKLRREAAGPIKEAERKLMKLERAEEAERPWRRRDFPYFIYGPTLD